MQSGTRGHFFRLIGLIVSSSPLLADVLVVDPAGGGDFTYPQAAIDAASDGDTVLLRAGDYADFFLDGKGLLVVAETPGSATFGGGLVIENIAAGQRAVLSGLVVHGSVAALERGLLVVDCAGPVRLEGCVFEAVDADGVPPFGIGYDGAHVIDSDAVSFAGCTLRGGAGLAAASACPGAPGQQGGGAGLRAQGSRVSLHQCDVAGGAGGLSMACAVAGPGGPAVRATGGALYAAGSQLAGGPGGMTFSVCACGGDGGAALALDGATAQLLDAVLAPGLPAPGSFTGVPGAATELQGGATVSVLDGAAPALVALPAVERGAQLAVSVHGVPGELAVVAASIQMGWLDAPALHGPLLIGFPLLLPGLPLGAIGPGGNATVLLTAPALPAGVEVATFFMQAVAVDPLGAIRLTGARTVQVFEAGLLP